MQLVNPKGNCTILNAIQRLVFDKPIILLITLLLFSAEKGMPNGCTGSTFTIQYSHVCCCWQVCSNTISDCDLIFNVDWDFGDGGTASGDQPCHAYSTPGTYTVTMMVHGLCHFSSMHCDITHQITVGPNQTIGTCGIKADFTADTVCQRTPTSFFNNSAPASDTWHWDFGDGQTSTLENPTHAYDSCGAYVVTLSITDQTPCCTQTATDVVQKTVYVDCAPNNSSNALGDTSSYIYESTGLISANAVCLGDPTSFTFNRNPVDSIIDWLWSFNIDSTSTEVNPDFTFASCSDVTYNFANFVLTNTRGCTDNITLPVTVYCPVELGPLTYSNVLCNGDNDGRISVTPTGGTPPYSYQWNDPDSQTTPIAIGLSGGYYSVTISDANECEIELDSIEVLEPDPFVGTISTDDIECYGWNTGTAVLTMTGGTFPNQYIWSTGETYHTDSNLFAGTYYVTATDANGCTYMDTAVINENPEIMATVSSMPTDCGLCNGTATVDNVTGGSGGGFSFEWDANAGGQMTQTAVGLCGGIYTVLVKDDSVPFCAKSYAVPVTNLNAQPINTSSSGVTCFNDCDGTATVTIVGGCTEPPCLVEWHEAAFGTSIGQDTTVATGLCAGDYFVRVVNGLGCESFETVTINGPDEIMASISPTGISCPGACDGRVLAMVSGGTGPYTFRWLDSTGNPIPFQFSPNLVNVCPGDYLLVVTDQHSCRDTLMATVPDYVLSATTIASNISCNGDCTGSIAVIPTGGMPPYTFQWLNSNNLPIPNETNATISDLCAGIYSVSITDDNGNGCTFVTPQVTISQPSALSLATSVTDVSCYGACDGSASVNVSGGKSPYRYQWSDSLGINIPGATSNTINSLCPGVYRVLVIDSYNCRLGPTFVTITEPDSLYLSANVTHINCGVGGQGSIDLTVHGGTLPYLFDWNSGTYNTEDINGLAAGPYDVVVTDDNGNGCTVAGTWNVQQPSPLNVSLTIVPYDGGYHNSCANKDDGIIIAIPNGGTPPYTYLWNDPDSQMTSTAIGLDLGTYTVIVTDDIGCTTTGNATLSLEPLPLTLTDSIVNITCGDDSSGSISVAASGGTPPYFYFWNAPDTVIPTPNLTNIPAGQYIVNVVDTNNCLLSDTFDVTLPNAFTISVVGYGVSCFGRTDGAADLTVNGGIGPFTYSWNNGDYSTEDLNGVPADFYTVDVTDLGNNCTATESVTIPEPLPLEDTAIVTNLSCNGSSDGAINLTVTGGTEPYSFNWNNGTFGTEDISGLPPGPYNVQITDDSSCILQDSFNITEPPLITATRMVSICNGDSFFVGGAYQNVAGAYNDTYTAANNCDSFLTTDLVLLDSIVTQYDTSVCQGSGIMVNGALQTKSGLYIDSSFQAKGGCDSIVHIDLSVIPGIDGDTIDICRGHSTTLSVDGNFPGAEYLWSPGGQTTPSIDDVKAGDYELQLTQSNGCVNVAYFTVNVVGGVDIYAEPDTATIEAGSSVDIEILHNSQYEIKSYSWTPTEGLDCANCPRVTAQPLTDQIYQIVAVDEFNCPDTVEVKIFLESNPFVYVPNAFSPNGDGQNDVFYVYVKGFLSYHLLIFDRWGEKMFESYDPTEGWDGSFNGELQNPGVFVYYLDIEFINGVEPPEYLQYKKGSITLLR